MVYLEAAIQGFSLKWSFILGILGEFPYGGTFPVKLHVVYLPIWWKWAPSYFASFLFVLPMADS